MGLFDKLASFLGIRRKDCNVLVVGLDNSGKSTVLNHFKSPDCKDSNVVPTIGFSVEKFKYKNVHFTAWDMSGQGRYRNLWEHYYSDCQGVIYVVDSADKLRLAVAKDELDILLKHPEIKSRSLPILVLANKMDLRDALSPVKIVQGLGLDQDLVKDKPWQIAATNALTGDGLAAGADWLSDQIQLNLSRRK
ncbi:unnamed protein product [Notodromas monacha]|uniref:ADP-ribosylation factor-like protein 6 n=1 Tax=Notodromas monacha TaxID=399045 RepID=A0A7R9BWQ8_9CRUS|nr:unnamed protein product [Notodromas monacha]CAG0922061.1 unnamed protein product [Notodromas monacha]